MKEVEYIIVGLGIAGICFAETLLQEGKSFLVIEDGKKGATTASGGVLNPAVLKRFTAAWNAPQFLTKAYPFYETIGNRVGETLICPIGIQRIFNTIEEQNDWMVASDKIEMSAFLTSEIQHNKNPCIKAPLGIGSVRGGALLQPAHLVESYRQYLKQQELLVVENFDYKLFNLTETSVCYQNYIAKHLVFAQGASVRTNPFFKIPETQNKIKTFVGNKGEYVVFKAPQLQLNDVLKGPMMVIPLGDDLYKVGATYSREDYSEDTTAQAKEEILTKLKKMISCNFEVVHQVSGIRPTVRDRKPLLGSFLENPNVYFFSGLGTRGLSAAPLLSEWLFQYIEGLNTLPAEVNLKRFL